VDRKHSDTNYGCQIILWDRVFGTYCGDEEVGQIGAGKAVPLSIKEQLMLAFYPNKRLIDL
jgi:sterol desaturase/sphingolipid hydroxylase (fatty acid hydroxylase superfamily)